jgi:hypothetical protein
VGFFVPLAVLADPDLAGRAWYVVEIMQYAKVQPFHLSLLTNDLSHLFKKYRAWA